QTDYLNRLRTVNDNHGLGSFLIMYEQFVPNPPPSQPPPLIQNLVVNDTSTANSPSVDGVPNSLQWSVQSNFQPGATVFGDRSYTLATSNAALNGKAWIRTAADSKGYSATATLASLVLNGTGVFLLV